MSDEREEILIMFSPYTILFFVDVDEWYENPYNAVNLGDIPDEIWNLYPSNRKYIANIMKFAGYVNRESILRLKCDGDITSMLKYVADRSKLVKDKEAMFGEFELYPSLLAIHPGLKPTFNRFITIVENLVPKRKTPGIMCSRATSQIEEGIKSSFQFQHDHERPESCNS